MSARISLGASALSISETDNVVMVPIIRTGSLDNTVVVHYSTISDTADDDDYIANIGSITLKPNVSWVTVPILLTDDDSRENTESFIFSIISVDNGDLEAPRTTRINIQDNESIVGDVPLPPLSSAYDVTEAPVITGLNQPLDLEFLPTNGSLVYVAGKQGKIEVYNIHTGSFVSTFLDISDKVNSNSDRGLMDIALDPDFARKPYVYAFYVVDPPDTAAHTGNAGPDGGGNRFSYVVRFTADPSTGYTTVLPGSEKILLGGAGKTLADISGKGAIDSTKEFDIADSSVLSGSKSNVVYKDDYLKVDSRSHVGGSLAFGPDGALYVSVGDGTSFNAVDPRSVSVQSLDSLSGKILRINPENGQGLPDNPFVDQSTSLDSNRSKVYQLGLRNPFSISFDNNGRLFISDTGWYTYEEINTGGPGANFGWPFFEGGDGGVSRPTPGYKDLAEAKAFYKSVQNGDISLTAAFRAFSHKEEAPGHQIQAITAGGVDYTGSRYPSEFAHSFFFSDYAQGEVYFVDLNDRTKVKFLYNNVGGYGPIDFIQGPDGFVYYINVGDGQIGRLLISKDNHLAGTLGADRMHGGRGDDTYIVNNSGDQTAEGRGQGSDSVKAIVTYSLSGQFVETLRLLGSEDIDATGNGLSNLLTGNAGANKLTGRLGDDVLSGGSGRDTFVFRTQHESTVSEAGRDVIRDFRHGQHDKIDLHLIDANTRTSGDQAFHFIGTRAFGHQAGDLQAKFTVGGNTLLSGDMNGDAKADFSIVLRGHAGLHVDDFIL